MAFYARTLGSAIVLTFSTVALKHPTPGGHRERGFLPAIPLYEDNNIPLFVNSRPSHSGQVDVSCVSPHASASSVPLGRQMATMYSSRRGFVTSSVTRLRVHARSRAGAVAKSIFRMRCWFVSHEWDSPFPPTPHPSHQFSVCFGYFRKGGTRKLLLPPPERCTHRRFRAAFHTTPRMVTGSLMGLNK